MKIVFSACTLVLFLMGQTTFAQQRSEAELKKFVENTLKAFPVPPVKSNSLFYLQRNKNTNTVVYEANLMPNGQINPEAPIRVYWIRYTEANEIKELNWIQRWLAYGVDVDKRSSTPGSHVVIPVALKNRKVTVTMDKSGRPAAYILLNGQQARLTRIYAEASETSWLPTVKFVQLKGVSVETGQEVYEYIIPKGQ